MPVLTEVPPFSRIDPATDILHGVPVTDQRVDALTDRLALLCNQLQLALWKKESLMSLLVLKAYAKLIHFDLYLARGDFGALYNKVRSCPVGPYAPAPDAIEKLCSAVDMACIWYWKQVHCLQRSAVTTCLLRRVGVPAQLVIGAQLCPFRAHAWVEVKGSIVNDRPYLLEMYTPLERC